jgi:hypothetical protein
MSCGIGERCEFFEFFFGGVMGGVKQPIKHLLDSSSIAGHFAGQAEISIAVEAEELSLFPAERQDL